MDAPGEFGSLGPRYGICCPNNSDYRSYERAQVSDLLTRYQFDAVFFDMMFWPAVCGCESCRERYYEEEGAPRAVFLKPGGQLTALIAPQHHVSFFPFQDSVAGGLLRLRCGEGEVLATLALPYAHPKPGRADDRNWASIHSSPPWEETETPLIVGNQYGGGRCTYSAAPLESVDHPAARRLFVFLLRELLGGPARFEAEAHPAIWVNGFDQPDAGRIRINFLNPLSQSGPIPAFSVPFELRPPTGRRFRGLSRVPDRTPLPFETDADGTLRATLDDLVDFRMLVAEYE